MSSILDIDLDYFRCIPQPLDRLDELLQWTGRPVDAVFDQHHHALKVWTAAIQRGVMDAPEFILHLDEHHDLLGERPPINPGNFLYFAMRRWFRCKVHWMVEMKIDSPRQWLSEGAWAAVAGLFTSGRCLPRSWPKPDMVTVATSPGFLDERLRRRLVKRVEDRGVTWTAKKATKP